jgi:hypothetical protein
MRPLFRTSLTAVTARRECTTHKPIITSRRFRNTISKITGLGIYSFAHPNIHTGTCTNQLRPLLAWSSSKRRYAKCVKCSACASSVAMLFRKPTSRKRGSYKRTTQRGSVADMVRWPAQGPRGGNLRPLYNSSRFFGFPVLYAAVLCINYRQRKQST